eukprot:TRINITY_DN408_c0_g1_i2.p1 TRINITY_DN408_c0_g1~~TRINITY_DN408_c0_g1_i2.p1  ORF type:complete len:1331 (-),score=308.92 TRINITY_DN408_c0_g1_i2:91-4083(-)
MANYDETSFEIERRNLNANFGKFGCCRHVDVIVQPRPRCVCPRSSGDTSIKIRLTGESIGVITTFLHQINMFAAGSFENRRESSRSIFSHMHDVAVTPIPGSACRAPPNHRHENSLSAKRLFDDIPVFTDARVLDVPRREPNPSRSPRSTRSTSPSRVIAPEIIHRRTDVHNREFKQGHSPTRGLPTWESTLRVSSEYDPLSPGRAPPSQESPLRSHSPVAHDAGPSPYRVYADLYAEPATVGHAQTVSAFTSTLPVTPLSLPTETRSPATVTGSKPPTTSARRQLALTDLEQTHIAATTTTSNASAHLGIGKATTSGVGTEPLTISPDAQDLTGKQKQSPLDTLFHTTMHSPEAVQQRVEDRIHALRSKLSIGHSYTQFSVTEQSDVTEQHSHLRVQDSLQQQMQRLDDVAASARREHDQHSSNRHQIPPERSVPPVASSFQYTPPANAEDDELLAQEKQAVAAQLQQQVDMLMSENRQLRTQLQHAGTTKVNATTAVLQYTQQEVQDVLESNTVLQHKIDEICLQLADEVERRSTTERKLDTLLQMLRSVQKRGVVPDADAIEEELLRTPASSAASSPAAVQHWQSNSAQSASRRLNSSQRSQQDSLHPHIPFSHHARTKHVHAPESVQQQQQRRAASMRPDAIPLLPLDVLVNDGEKAMLREEITRLKAELSGRSHVSPALSRASPALSYASESTECEYANDYERLQKKLDETAKKLEHERRQATKSMVEIQSLELDLDRERRRRLAMENALRQLQTSPRRDPHSPNTLGDVVMPSLRTTTPVRSQTVPRTAPSSDYRHNSQALPEAAKAHSVAPARAPSPAPRAPKSVPRPSSAHRTVSPAPRPVSATARARSPMVRPKSAALKRDPSPQGGSQAASPAIPRPATALPKSTSQSQKKASARSSPIVNPKTVSPPTNDAAAIIASHAARSKRPSVVSATSAASVTLGTMSPISSVSSTRASSPSSVVHSIASVQQHQQQAESVTVTGSTRSQSQSQSQWAKKHPFLQRKNSKQQEASSAVDVRLIQKKAGPSLRQRIMELEQQKALAAAAATVSDAKSDTPPGGSAVVPMSVLMEQRPSIVSQSSYQFSDVSDFSSIRDFACSSGDDSPSESDIDSDSAYKLSPTISTPGLLATESGTSPSPPSPALRRASGAPKPSAVETILAVHAKHYNEQVFQKPAVPPLPRVFVSSASTPEGSERDAMNSANSRTNAAISASSSPKEDASNDPQSRAIVLMQGMVRRWSARKKYSQLVNDTVTQEEESDRRSVREGLKFLEEAQQKQLEEDEKVISTSRSVSPIPSATITPRRPTPVVDVQQAYAKLRKALQG